MRLAEGVVLRNEMEVPIPVRFVFLLLTPDHEQSLSEIDPHEVGRSFSTMMSNPVRLYQSKLTVYKLHKIIGNLK